MPRFVILHHRVSGGSTPLQAAWRMTPQGEPVGDHFDWMFETDDRLRTWATEVPSSLEDSFEVDALSLADHRQAYLDYEGEVSRGRGRVTRVLGGSYQIAESSDGKWSGQLQWTESGEERRADWSLYRRCLDESEAELARAVWRLCFSPWR